MTAIDDTDLNTLDAEPDTTLRNVPDSFCVLPWLHLCGSVDGVWGRCCVDNSMYHDHLYTQDEEPDFQLHEDALGCLPNSRYAATNPERTFGLSEAFNSPQLRRTRLQLLAGERPSACSYCYRREDAGGESYRNGSNRRFADLPDLDRRIAATAPDGSLDEFPIFLDIRMGNSCNLRCVMCAYPTSSNWGLQRRPAWSSAAIDPYRDDDELWETVRQNAHLLRRMYFAGGEPFMQPGHFRMLDLLIEADVAGAIDVVYNSNLTILPDGVFEKLAQFKSVGIGASCDGVGEVFERIRTGARWEVFVRNVREAKRHVRVWLQVAPQRDNIAHIDEIVEFARQEGIEADLTNIVHWPEHLSIAALPRDRKDRHRDELTALAERCRVDGRERVAQHLGLLADFLTEAAADEPHAAAGAQA